MSAGLDPQTRIMVTGGSGFLGRHIVAELTERGYRHITVPRSRDYDLRTPDGVRRAYADLRPQIVIHLAALAGGIGVNRANPATFFYDNLMMGSLVLEHARLAGVEKFVAIGTICSYPKHTPVPFREADLWQGYPEETNAPYGLAKKMLWCKGRPTANSTASMPSTSCRPICTAHTTTRPRNVPCHRRLIRKYIEAKEAGREEVVTWGTGRQTREYLYVADAAGGIVTAMEHYNGPQPVNLGTGREISIRELTELIASMVGFQGRITWDTSKPDGQPRRCLDTSRARELFGWEATTPLETGLRRTIAWYQQARQST